jgi:eukaryotic-like serine/threonine-protein kinase
MATVYLGWQDSDGGVTLPIAAKVMHPHAEDDPRLVPMMLSEARIASRIRHPNVVSLTDVVSSERGPVLILEYVAGASLGHALELPAHTMPWPIASRILVDALEGLHAAHDATNESGMPLCVVHRDVSPQNILVDEAGHAKIADFGVAKALERAYATQSGEVRGKLAYMAPEQLAGKAVDRRADVWGLGMVLWHMLAGQRPFEGLESGPTMDRISLGAIDLPSSIRACPSALEQVCMRALALSPDDRYATARLMALDLERAESPASHRDVARWLKRAASTLLSTRAGLVAEMEGIAVRARRRRAEAPVETPSETAPRQVVSASEADLQTTGATTVEEPAAPASTGPRFGRPLTLLGATLLAILLVAVAIAAVLRRGPKEATSAGDAASVSPEGTRTSTKGTSSGSTP